MITQTSLLISKPAFHTTLLAGLTICLVTFGVKQQEGQHIPGQQGLNAGVLPTPAFTYANITINYSADLTWSVLTVTQANARK